MLFREIYDDAAQPQGDHFCDVSDWEDDETAQDQGLGSIKQKVIGQLYKLNIVADFLNFLFNKLHFFTSLTPLQQWRNMVHLWMIYQNLKGVLQPKTLEISI